MDEAKKLAREIVSKNGMNPDVFWELADDIYCALVDAGFEAAFGPEERAVIRSKEPPTSTRSVGVKVDTETPST